MHHMIETCPYCHEDCALPASMKDLQSWPVICHACDMIFEAKAKDEQSSSSKQAPKQFPHNIHSLICDHCHYQMHLPRGDFKLLCETDMTLSCPNCREDISLSADKRTDSAITISLIIFIFIALTASMWHALTPQGEEARAMIQPYLAAPYHYLGELRLAFADLITFIRGLFL